MLSEFIFAFLSWSDKLLAVILLSYDRKRWIGSDATSSMKPFAQLILNFISDRFFPHAIAQTESDFHRPPKHSALGQNYLFVACCSGWLMKASRMSWSRTWRDFMRIRLSIISRVVRGCELLPQWYCANDCQWSNSSPQLANYHLLPGRRLRTLNSLSCFAFPWTNDNFTCNFHPRPGCRAKCNYESAKCAFHIIRIGKLVRL